MTVKELIEELKKMSPDREVLSMFRGSYQLDKIQSVAKLQVDDRDFVVIVREESDLD